MSQATGPYYVALGDSMSIDLYPRVELQAGGRIGPHEPAAVGGASLFHENRDDLWPEFERRDLVSRAAGIEKRDVAADGATIGHTRDHQLPLIAPPVREATEVVTLTAGGNDLLGGVFDGFANIEPLTEETIRRYGDLVELLVSAFPAARLILTTVYDPTDGTGTLPGISGELGRLPIELLDRFNDAVRGIAAGTDRARLADAHRHFMGHGLSGDAGESWYWAPSPIEPGARGASEIRRLWLEAMEDNEEYDVAHD